MNTQIKTFRGANPDKDAQKWANEMQAQGYTISPPSITTDKLLKTHICVMATKIV